MGKDGYERATGILTETADISSVPNYDAKFKLADKNYDPKCDVCIAQEQGYGCSRIIEDPGPYEYEGGCMDCKHICGKPPIHIGVRNYCQEHMHILNKKLGIGTALPVPLP